MNWYNKDIERSAYFSASNNAIRRNRYGKRKTDKSMINNANSTEIQQDSEAVALQVEKFFAPFERMVEQQALDSDAVGRRKSECFHQCEFG